MMDGSRIGEIAPDHETISILVPEFDLRLNHFRIKNDKALLFYTGLNQMSPNVTTRRYPCVLS